MAQCVAQSHVSRPIPHTSRMILSARRSFAVNALSATFLFAWTASSDAQVIASDEGMIRSARTLSNRAIAAHDTGAMASVLLPEFHQVSSTNAQSSGRAAAVTLFARLFASRPDVVYLREPSKVIVNAEWGQAAESGKWTGHWTQADGVTRVGGDYFAKWKKMDGRWLLLAEIFVQTSCSGTRYCVAPPPLAPDATVPHRRERGAS